MFTVTGLIGDRRVEVRWLGPGQIDGDAEAVARIRSAVNGGLIRPHPMGPDVPAQLDEPWLACVTIWQTAFDRLPGWDTITGDVPETPDVWKEKPGVIY
jgi:hypothetical protein